MTERSKRFIVKEKRPERKSENGRGESSTGESREREREHDTEGKNISSS